jgi:hypothetical protein
MGYNFFNPKNKIYKYYKKIFIDLYKYNNIPYIDENKFEKRIFNSLDFYEHKYFFILDKNLNLIKKSLMIKFLNFIGIFCVLIGISSFNLPFNYENLVSYIALYNFSLLILSMFSLFSQFLIKK